MQDSYSGKEPVIEMAGCWAVKVAVCMVSGAVMSDSATPWTAAHQAPLSMGFSRQDWRGLPFPSAGYLPDPGMEPASPMSSASQADSLLLSKGSGYREVRSRDNASDCELGVLYRLPAKYRGRSQNASQPQIHVDNKSKYVASVNTEETNNKLVWDQYESSKTRLPSNSAIKNV